MYYYLSGANNPTQLSIVMYGMNTDGQIRDVIRVLEERKVEYVLWDTAVKETTSSDGSLPTNIRLPPT